MKITSILLFCLCVLGACGQDNPYAECCESYCYRDDEHPYLYLGTKTAYEFVFGKASNQHIVPHCRAVQFWSFNRHGTRLPNKSNIKDLEKLQRIKEEIIKNYDNRGSYPETGRLCDKDLEGFRRWSWNYTIAMHENDLTEQGKDDMRYLARRYQTRYPELLRGQYSDQFFKFRYTATDRTRKSFEAFAEGLFGSDSYKVHGFSAPNDTVINAYDYCNAWKEKVENPEYQTEFNILKESNEYKSLVAHVSRRLGFRYTLNETLIGAMYDMCRFEKSWYVNRNSAWCAVFTKGHLRLLEYMQDVYYYYKSGYGLHMNEKLGCFPMRDMLNKFERIVNGDMTQPKAVVYFTHSAALQQLLVALGINKDNLPLTADNMRSQVRRQWRTSIVSPFSANLAAVLYECNQNERHRVMFFLNERPVDYPGCSVGLCSWEFLRQQLSETADNCDLEFCNESTANTFTVSLLTVISSLVFTYITKL